MKYSTLKKTVALSCASLLLVGAASAQTDSTKKATPVMSDTAKTAKVFGGLGQYKTFSLGLSGGITSPTVLTGGINDWHAKISWAVSGSARVQLSHFFSIEGDLLYGRLEGTGEKADFYNNGAQSGDYFKTKLWQPSISGRLDFGSVSFLHRKNAINFFGTAGIGYDIYQPSGVLNGAPFTYADYNGSTNHYVWEMVIPVGVGINFRLTDSWALKLGYTEQFSDGDNLDGYHHNYPSKDKFGFAYAGLEWTLGSSSKPNIEWVNPIAMAYDELYDEALRQEVAALKVRVGNVENAVNDLKKDSDGDGVSDQFDKCPGTPAGTVVDGSGCPIKFPTPDTTAKVAVTPYGNIQFDFDSSILRTSSYPALDATSADLRSSGKSVEVDGFASSEGTAAHNLVLSKDRANSVKTYLINSGVDAKRLKVKGYGETHPIADNSTEAGRILNRRVEFKQK